ncbi:hypothetical protein [Streptomyces griseosporeus]|uniref:hypothetical protein n=1 Tax=Streptomyces griseosporeus TaxID=1910 RepID=UPI0036F8ACF9
MSIENTRHPSSAHATALLALATGDTNAVIEAQEKSGQAQLVHSDQLPARIDAYDGGDQAAFEALGFTFGPVDERDPLFRPATLPTGWTKQASGHDMWSYIVDERGRRRVRIFYKAAFYDRSAEMSLVTVEAYVSDCHHQRLQIVTDDTWATPAAVAQAARKWAERAAENAAMWEQRARTAGPATGREDYERWAAEHRADRDAYLAIAAQHTTT